MRVLLGSLWMWPRSIGEIVLIYLPKANPFSYSLKYLVFISLQTAIAKQSLICLLPIIPTLLVFMIKQNQLKSCRGQKPAVGLNGGVLLISARGNIMKIQLV